MNNAVIRCLLKTYLFLYYLVLPSLILFISSAGSCTNFVCGDPKTEVCVNNAVTGPACQCKPGFEGTVGACKDINECQLQQSGTICRYASCLNTFGSYMCFCKPGYQQVNTTYCEGIYLPSIFLISISSFFFLGAYNYFIFDRSQMSYISEMFVLFSSLFFH